jgi:hypothetical protein
MSAVLKEISVDSYYHPKLGSLLIFDTTSEVTPFGQLRGHLQGSWGC